jgi:hypothetical protein
VSKSMRDRKVSRRNQKPFDLPKDKKRNTEAWFYTNEGSIDLVLYETGRDGVGTGVSYRFKLRDMEKIVKDMQS